LFYDIVLATLAIIICCVSFGIHETASTGQDTNGSTGVSNSSNGSMAVSSTNRTPYSGQVWVPLHWKVAQTMFWVKVLYGLLMLPFAVFTLPIFSKALTGAYPTGYTRQGVLAPLLTGSKYSQARAEQKDAVCCPRTHKSQVGDDFGV
jgi:hypothetical protein